MTTPDCSDLFLEADGHGVQVDDSPTPRADL